MNRKRVDVVLASMLMATILCFFFRNTSFFEAIHNRASLVAIFYLFVGLTALILSLKKSLFVAMGLSAVTCLYLKSASNTDLKLPEYKESKLNFSISHYNLASISEPEVLLDRVMSHNSDIISFHELTPDWNRIIGERLKELYPNKYVVVRIDPYGKSVYSKFPLSNIRRLKFGEAEDLTFTVKIDEEECVFVSTYLIPSLDNLSTTAATKQLENLEAYLRDYSRNNLLVLGEFNMVYWKDPIRKFRNNLDLIHSRRNASINGSLPFEHFFYNEQLECTFFEEIEDTQQAKIGIRGRYQTKEPVMIGSL